MSQHIADTLAAGGGETAKFLNDIITMLWPNICVAGSQMTQEIANPMFKQMLPGPLSTLHFTKVDFGHVPMHMENVLATKTETGGIKLDMNLVWKGKADIELDANMFPSLGVENLELHGRLSVLLGPLTNVIPLIGAAQVAFINPPDLKLDFTGAANVADFDAVDGSVRKVIIGIINSMATLPNRYLVNLDTNNDFFNTYLPPLGILRVTVNKAYGFSEESKGKASKFLSKITRAAPDAYASVSVGAEEAWKTSTKSNTHNPAWNETHDFIVSDFDQHLKLDILDEDVNGDDEIGLGMTTVKEAILAGNTQELPLTHRGEQTSGKVSVGCQFFRFDAVSDSFTASEHKAGMCGLATVLVAGAFDLQGARKDLKPSVKISWGEKHKFQTAIKEDAPGTDISNPGFDQSFRIPLTTDAVNSAGAFRIELMNADKEVGKVDVPFADVQKAENMTLRQKFDMGDGATVRASIVLRGVESASMEEARKALPDRSAQAQHAAQAQGGAVAQPPGK